MKRNDEVIANHGCSLGNAASLHPLENPSLCTLTAAEKKILARVSLAKTNKEIACELRISPATVKRHLENILRKVGLRNRVEAAIYGLLMITGCSQETNPGCALLKWWNGRVAAS